MNVSELFDLTHWITSEIEETQIPQKYQTLQTTLHPQSESESTESESEPDPELESKPEQQKQSIESQEQDLLTTLKNVPSAQLTPDQLEFLNHLGIAQAVGEEGINTIEDILHKNVVDAETSAQKLQQILQQINEGINKSNQIKSGLEGYAVKEEREANNEILTRISFTGHALIANVIDFKNWADIWYDICQGIAMAQHSPLEEIKIAGTTKDPITIELAVTPSIATTISEILLAALKVTDKVLDIKTKAKELKELKLKNDKFAQDLAKEADYEKKTSIEYITGELVKKLKLKVGEGDKVKALETSVKNLINFIEKGGVIDFTMPEDDQKQGAENKNEQLRATFQEIHQLEKKLSSLEHNAPEDTETPEDPEAP